MKTKTFVIIIMGICYVFISLTTSIQNTIMHEEAHQKIFEYYGVDSVITYDITWMGIKGTTWGNHTQIMESPQYETMMSLQVMNEVVGYQYDTLLSIALTNLFVVMVVFVFIVNTHKKDDDEEEDEYTFPKVVTN